MMINIAYNQIFVLILQIFLVSSVLLLIFRLRSIFGLGPLYATLGVFQYMQVFLSSAIYIKIAPGILVSPGSVVLFTGGLFTILLIYIREDALEARKIIYALLTANLVLTLMHIALSFLLEGQYVENIYNLPKSFFTKNSLILLIGSLALFIDSIAIILAYEFVSRLVKSIFFRILITMTFIVTLDSILFSLVIFSGITDLQNFFVSGLLSKISSTLIYSIIFTLYLHIFEKIEDYDRKSSFNDIFHKLTYRQKFEKVSEEKESLINGIIKSAPVGIGFIQNRIIVYVNDQLISMLGYTSEEMVGQNSNIFYESLSEYEKIGKLYEELKSKDIAANEAKIKRKSGEVIEVIITLSPIDKNDYEKGFVFSVLDITEKVKNENIIIDERIRYKNLFENSPVPLWEEDFTELLHRLDELKSEGVTDFDNYFNSNPEILKEFVRLPKIINVNSATLKLHNAKTKEELYAGLDKIFTENSLEIFKQEIIAIANREKYYKTEGEVKTLDNMRKTVDLRLFIDFGDENNPKATALLTTIDISERKEFETKLNRWANVFKYSNWGVAVTDANKRVLEMINPAFAKMHGYTVEELEGQPIDILFSPKERSKIPKLISEAGQEGFLSIETEQIRKDGTIFPILANISVTKDSKGNLREIILNINDITNLKKTFDKLEKSEFELKEAQRIAKIGHWELDLKNNNLNWSDEVFRIFDLTPQSFEATYEAFLNNIHPEDRELVNKEYLNSVENKLPYNIVHRLKLKNNVIKYVREIGQTFYDDNDNPIKSIGTVQDITKFVLIEQKMEEELKRNQLILNTTNEGFILADVKGDIVDVNPAYCKLVGYTKEELKKMNIRELEISIPKEQVDDRIKKMVSQGFDSFETKHISKEGKEIDLSVSIAITEFDNEKLVAAFVKDITQAKQAERELRESKAFNENLINTSPDVIYIYDIVNKKNVFSNRGIESLLGYNSKEIKKFGEKLLEDLMHPKDMDNYLNNILPTYQQLKDGEVIEHEYRLKHKNGYWVWLRSKESIYVRNDAGKPSQIFGVCSDITQQKIAQAQIKESESNLAALINNSEDYIWSMDRNYKYLIFNKRYADIMYNIHGVEIKKGMDARDFIAKEELEFWEDKVDIALNGEQVKFEFDFEINGKLHYFETSFSPIFESNTITGISTRSTEITERKEAENQLKSTLEKLTKSRSQLRSLNAYVQDIREKERTEISREIHDTIGQSLTALKIDLSWLKMHLTVDDNKIKSKLAQMNELLDETTKIAQKISTELRPGILGEFGLSYAINWQCKEFEKRTNIKTIVKIDPENINLDEKTSVELFRILQESLTNIVRHAKASIVNVTLSQRSNMVEMMIIDNGIGITEDDINSVHSLGLLSITERANSINGKADFISNEKAGTTVKVVVDLEKEKELV